MKLTMLTVSDSPKTFLLSECPRITHSAPISLIMAGEISPTEIKLKYKLLINFLSILKTKLACECSFGYFVAVLSSYSDGGWKLLAGIVQIASWDTTNQF